MALFGNGEDGRASNAAVSMKGEPQVDACANWHVFETFVADGSLAIGVAQGTPDPSAVMIVREGLTRSAAYEAADRARPRRDRRGADHPELAHVTTLRRRSTCR